MENGSGILEAMKDPTLVDVFDAMVGRDISGPEYAVMTWLLRRALGPSGQLRPCWPSWDDIAAGSHTTTRTVARAVKGLREKGWIRTTSRPGGSTVYTIHIPCHTVTPDRESCHPCHTVIPPLTDSHTTPDRESYEEAIEEAIEEAQRKKQHLLVAKTHVPERGRSVDIYSFKLHKDLEVSDVETTREPANEEQQAFRGGQGESNAGAEAGHPGSRENGRERADEGSVWAEAEIFDAQEAHAANHAIGVLFAPLKSLSSARKTDTTSEDPTRPHSGPSPSCARPPSHTQPALPDMPAIRAVAPVEARETTSGHTDPSEAPARPQEPLNAIASVHAAWQVHADREGRHRHRTLPPSWQRSIRARVDEHGLQAVLDVVDWWWLAPEAQYLREGKWELDTIIRESKAPKYVEQAREWREAQALAARIAEGERIAREGVPETPEQLERRRLAQVASVERSRAIVAKMARRQERKDHIRRYAGQLDAPPPPPLL